MDLSQKRLARYGERVYRMFLASVADYAMCAMDIDGRIVSWNLGCARTFDYDETEVIGRPIGMLFTQEDRQANIPEQILRNADLNGRVVDERWHVRKDGSRFWGHGVAIPVRESDGTLIGFGRIIRDQTDLKELQEALRTRAAELAQASEDKSVFIATLVHELRSPLTVLTSYNELLSTDRPQLAPMIGRQVDHIKRLVDDLMDIVRIGHKKLRLQRRSLDLREVIRRAVEMALPAAESHGVTIEMSVPATPVTISGDDSRLLQVFANLLGNAVKFSNSGGRVSIGVASEADEAVTLVEDRGIGIPSEQLASIFELFAQGAATLPASEAGLGIGLSLVRDLVALHDGTIQVLSEGTGTGSQFIVRLPLLIGEQGITSSPTP